MDGGVVFAGTVYFVCRKWGSHRDGVMLVISQYYLSNKRKKKKKPPVQIQMQAGHAATHKYHCIRDLCHSVARIHTLWLEFIPSVGRIHINARVHTPDALLLTKASRTVCFWSKILLLRGPIASGEESPSLI